MATYRTKTYIAGDWDHDKDAVDKLYQWNGSNYWSLSFTDAHDLTQANDSSLNCSIKSSLKTRLDASKRFVLIVGNSTNTVTAGSCTLVIHILVQEDILLIIEVLLNTNAIKLLKQGLRLLCYIKLHA